MIRKLNKNEVEKLKLLSGHNFKDVNLVTQAFTHSSFFANVSSNKTKKPNYERLEFLGDRILGIIIADLLYELFPEAKEGELSKRFNALVNTDRCASIAKDIGLTSFLRASSDLSKTNSKAYHNIYADIMEAFIAALYLDGGLEIAAKFVCKYWQNIAESEHLVRADAKTTLQEWAHKQCGMQPNYNVIKCEGPEHEPKYYIEVNICGVKSVIGVGSSKRDAQVNAAEQILYREGVWKK